MPALDGLYPFEKVMLYLGAGFFVSLAFVLVFLALKGKSYVKLLPFFFVSVVLMGWPSIKSIQFGENSMTINKDISSLASANPDPAAAEELKTVYPNVAARPSSDPATLTLLARASLAVGDTKAAAARVEQALALNPKYTEAADLKARIEAEPKLEELTERFKSDETSGAATKQESRDKLQNAVAAVTKVPVVNPSTLTAVANAQAALGDTATANTTVSKALKIDPKLTQAMQLKEKLAANPGPH